MSETPPSSGALAPARPLRGLRVLDLTNVLAGPFCTYQLVLMGAEVIKIEAPEGGDLARQLGADALRSQDLMGASFLAQNAGKKSVVLDLKDSTGKTDFLRLVETADVVVENFRPGVMTRLGLGYETLKARKPNLVYCAISGFGQDGPMRGAPAYDQIIQGLSGAMSITGDSESAPLRVGYPVADSVGGMTAAFAIAAALVGRERSGEGAFIDVSMLDSTIATMGWIVSNYLIAGQLPVPMGNDNFTAAPSGAFETGDGLLNIAANKQEQFEAMARAIGRADLIDDARFSEREARKRNRAALTTEIEQALRARAAIEWETQLNDAGVPAGRVLSVPEALSLEQVAHRRLVQQVGAGADAGEAISVCLAGYHVNGAPCSVDRLPPRLGAHTEEVLGDLRSSHITKGKRRMSDKDPQALLAAAQDWWATSIIKMRPGVIEFRGYPVQELIGRVPFTQMIWLLLRGEMAKPGELALLEAALAASVDHGPHAPSIAIARMAISCGVDLNNAMASASNVLGDSHGGAGEQCMELLLAVKQRRADGASLDSAVDATLDEYVQRHGKIVPGYGHRFHPVDPRCAPLLGLVETAAAQGVVSGECVGISSTIEAALVRRTGKAIPMNIDGATAVIFAELGFAPPLGRGLFILSRSVGILAHAWEQMQTDERNKGPMPRQIPFTYTGPDTRPLPNDGEDT